MACGDAGLNSLGPLRADVGICGSDACLVAFSHCESLLRNIGQLEKLGTAEGR